MLTYVVLCYIFCGLTLSTIAKRRGIQNPWMAWVPVVNNMLLGSVADDYSQKKYGANGNLTKTLLILTIVQFGVIMVLSPIAAIPGVGAPLYGMTNCAISIILYVFACKAYYKIYESCKPEKAMAFLMLSIFIPVTTPFLLFSCRKEDRGMPAAY